MKTKSEDTFDLARFKMPLIMTIIFWAFAVVMWQITHNTFRLSNFGYISVQL